MASYFLNNLKLGEYITFVDIVQIEGYLLIPHELLHVLGYRLVGKRCVYHWGDHRVKALGSLSRDEQLFGLLFPLVVCVVLAIILLSPLKFPKAQWVKLVVSAVMTTRIHLLSPLL